MPTRTEAALVAQGCRSKRESMEYIRRTLMLQLPSLGSMLAGDVQLLAERLNAFFDAYGIDPREVKCRRCGKSNPRKEDGSKPALCAGCLTLL